MDKYDRIKGQAGIGQNPVMLGRVDPPPISPIQQELEELRDAIEALEKEHYELAAKLQPVIAIDNAVEKQVSASAEPSTGCAVKDKLADLKQRVLYIKRMTVDLRDRIWL